jgi:hypothetical protein
VSENLYWRKKTSKACMHTSSHSNMRCGAKLRETHVSRRIGACSHLGSHPLWIEHDSASSGMMTRAQDLTMIYLWRRWWRVERRVHHRPVTAIDCDNSVATNRTRGTSTTTAIPTTSPSPSSSPRQRERAPPKPATQSTSRAQRASVLVRPYSANTVLTTRVKFQLVQLATCAETFTRE